MRLTHHFSESLSAVRKALDCDFGIISYVYGEQYEVKNVDSEINTVKQGDIFKISDTYCAAVVDSEDRIIYNEVGKIKSMILHPIYTAMQLEAYIGEPLRAQGKVVGTLNFSSFSAKPNGFTTSDISLVHNLAKEIEAAIVDC